MTIEATLNDVLSTLKAIHTALASGAAVAPAATEPTPPAAAPADTKTRKPREVNTSPAATETKPAATAPAAKAADWKTDVMPVLLDINKSSKPEHGRAGLLNVMSKFGLPDGSKVPDLEKLGKHAEVLAYAKAVLAGETTVPVEEDDMGLGI
jgi:hypothetical protein